MKRDLRVGQLQACLPGHGSDTTASAGVPGFSTIDGAQVLMRTRSSESRERRRALAALSGIAGRLAEDYLLLLPEALPFLAELLEDPDPPTQAAAQALVQQLQDISGESLQVSFSQLAPVAALPCANLVHRASGGVCAND